MAEIGGGAEAPRGDAVMKRIALRAGLGAVIAVFLMARAPAQAVENDAASTFIQGLMTDAVAQLGGKRLTPTERAQAFAGLLDRYASIPATSDEVLGRYAADTPPADRARFQQTLLGYMLASWSDYLADLSPEQKLAVVRVEPQGERARVFSLVTVPAEEPVPVEWLVGSTPEGRPYVADVAMGGISIIRMMRADFTSVLYGTHGRVDGLIAALQKKIDVVTASRHAEAATRN
jgi:ABC-type transporter MlaC component